MVAVITLHDHRLVAVTKQASPLPVARVVAPCQRVLQPVNARHLIRLWTLDEEMVVIPHQDLGIHTPAGCFTGLAERVQEEAAVTIGAKHH